MRDAAGELPHGLHLLHLPELGLGGFTFGDLAFERGGTVAHPGFEPLVRQPQRRLGAPGAAEGAGHAMDQRNVDRNGQRVEEQRQPAVGPGRPDRSAGRDKREVGGEAPEHRRDDPRPQTADEGGDDHRRQEQDEGELVGGFAEGVADPERKQDGDERDAVAEPSSIAKSLRADKDVH